MDEVLSTDKSANSKVTNIADFDVDTEGYIVIIPMPTDTLKQIEDVQQTISNLVPSESLWLPKGDQLHVTFAHIISPDREYSKSRAEIYENLRDDVLESAKRASTLIESTEVSFNEVRISNDAIILVGLDDGSIDQARKTFTNGFSLPPESRQPPKIIHSTIARFKKSLPITNIETAIYKVQPNIKFTASELSLVQEHSIFLQSHTNLGSFVGGRHV